MMCDLQTVVCVQAYKEREACEGYSSPGRQGGSSGGSCGPPGPRTPVPPVPRPASSGGPDSEAEEETQARQAQYLTRNIILYTHYAGEVSNIVDEHFTKALQSTYSENKGEIINTFVIFDFKYTVALFVYPTG